MPAAILGYLGDWWARWFTRAGRGHASIPSDVFIPLPESDVPVKVEESTGELTLEQSFLETVRIVPQVAVARRPVRTEPDVRVRTLAALEGLRQIPALQSLVEGATHIM